MGNARTQREPSGSEVQLREEQRDVSERSYFGGFRGFLENAIGLVREYPGVVVPIGLAAMAAAGTVYLVAHGYMAK